MRAVRGGGSRLQAGRARDAGKQPITEHTSKTLSRCRATSARPQDLQCVRIEQNKDSSTTYYFSDGAPAFAWQQLTGQLAVTATATPAHARDEALHAAVPLTTRSAGSAGQQTRAAWATPEVAQMPEKRNGGGGRAAKLPRLTGPEAGSKPPRSAQRAGAVNGKLQGKPQGSAQPQTRGADIRADLERSYSESSEDEMPGARTRKFQKFRKHPRQSASNYARLVLAGLKERDEETLDLLSKFSELCRAGQLEAALTALSRFVEAGRKDVLVRLRQKHFLKEAARQASSRSVKQALSFVQLLPRTYATLQTYNMMVTVAAQAKDMAAAMQALELLRSHGRRPDAFLYTNVISACAAAGDADAAFRTYAEMTRDGLPIDKQSATSLINACSQEILGKCSYQRRRQLVLLERADTVLREFAATHRGKMDQGIWNAFITAAGRASQLQRAVRALGEMQAAGMKPSQTTYGALMDACVRNNNKKLALDTYQRAMKAGMATSLHLHTGAIAACRSDKDITTALSIFHEMQRHGIQADERLYGVLLSVVGSASLSSALDLHDTVLGRGDAPFRGVHSDLIDACLEHGELEAARDLYDRAHRLSSAPPPHITNAVLNAFGKTGAVEEVSRLLLLATEAGFSPDKYTYAAVLTACQYAGAGDLAFSVWRLMQVAGIPLDEASGFILIRTCFNQLQQARGIPRIQGPVNGIVGSKQAHRDLLQALAGSELPAAVSSTAEDNLPWSSRAIAVYQKLLASGIPPRLHVLERLFACLRLRPLPQKPGTANTLGAPVKVREFLLPDGRQASAPQHSIDGIYEKRVFSILEEASSTGVLARYSLGSSAPVDLCRMPPMVAEVYVLDILSTVTSEAARRRSVSPIVLKTPPFNSWQREPAAATKACSDQPIGDTQQASATPAEDRSSSRATGSAVAALLKRLNIRSVGNPSSGDIILTSNAVSRWRLLADRAAANVEMAALSSLQLAGHLRTSIHDQQRQIRLGMRAESRPVLGDMDRARLHSCMNFEDDS